MPLPVITDHYFVQARFARSNDDAVVNSYCFRNHMPVGTSQQAIAQSLRDLLDSFYGNRTAGAGTVGDYLSIELFNLVYTIYDLGVPNAPAIEIPSATWPTSAGTAQTSMPPDSAIVVSWRTALRGRSYRGRTYLGPLHTATMASNGMVTSTVRTRLGVAAFKLIGNEGTRNFQLAVLSRTLGKATLAIGGHIDGEFDTQRRRGFRTVQRTNFGA